MLVRPTLGLLLCTTIGLSLACATARPPAPGARAPQASTPPRPEAPALAGPTDTTGLSFTVEPADAEVVIDGQSVGAVSGLAQGGVVPLPPGLYQVSLKRAGYATWRAEVAVHSGIQSIRVTLTRR